VKEVEKLLQVAFAPAPTLPKANSILLGTLSLVLLACEASHSPVALVFLLRSCGQACRVPSVACCRRRWLNWGRRFCCGFWFR
jgi:hypothetical protein